MRKAFADTMVEVGAEDEKLVVLVGDISHNLLLPYSGRFPDRYYNVGILEQAIVGMGAGLSLSGMRPVIHTITPFLIERAFEQIKLDFCYQQLGGTLVSVGSAFDYSGLGCSHHSYTDMAMIKGLPRTQVIYPASEGEFKQLFRQTYKNDLLTYFRLPADKHGEDLGDVVVGKGVKVRDGAVTICCSGPQLKTVLDSGRDADVLYFHTLKPFDGELVRQSVMKTGNVTVIDEHSMYGGLADEVRRALTGMAYRWHEITIPDEFQHGYGSRSDHLKALGYVPDLL